MDAKQTNYTINYGDGDDQKTQIKINYIDIISLQFLLSNSPFDEPATTPKKSAATAMSATKGTLRQIDKMAKSSSRLLVTHTSLTQSPLKISIFIFLVASSLHSTEMRICESIVTILIIIYENIFDRFLYANAFAKGNTQKMERVVVENTRIQWVGETN